MSTLIEMAKAGDTARVREMLRPRWWRKPAPDKADKWGCTALHFAAEAGHLEIATLLLETGADVNATNRFAHTPLHNAAREGRLELVNLLLAKGAEVNGTGKQDGSPLHWAIRERRTLVIKALLSAGAATGNINREGQNAAQVAEIHGTPEILAMLQNT